MIVKRFFHTIYLIGISLFLYGSIISQTKGFDMEGVIKSEPGFSYLIFLFIATFVVMFFAVGKSPEKEKTENKSLKKKEEGSTEEKNEEKVKKLDKDAVEKYLVNTNGKDDDSVKVEFSVEEKTVTTIVYLKKMEQDEAGKFVDELKEKIKSGLKNKFELTEKEVELKFIIENKKEEGK